MAPFTVGADAATEILRVSLPSNDAGHHFPRFFLPDSNDHNNDDSDDGISEDR